MHSKQQTNMDYPQNTHQENEWEKNRLKQGPVCIVDKPNSERNSKQNCVNRKLQPSRLNQMKMYLHTLQFLSESTIKNKSMSEDSDDYQVSRKILSIWHGSAEILKEKQMHTYHKQINQSNYISSISLPIKSFVHKNLQYNQKLQAFFMRKKQGINYFTPQYDMIFKDGLSHLISAKKQIGPKLHFQISVDKEQANNKDSKYYCGRLTSDFSSCKFNLYRYRKGQYELVLTSIFKQEEPIDIRTYQVYMLKESVVFSSLQGASYTQKPLSLDKLYFYANNKTKMYHFKTKKPEYLKELKAYFLDFGGRVTRASVKNFILIDPKSEREVAMFGRGNGDNFNLQMSYPLTPFLGIGLILPFMTNK